MKLNMKKLDYHRRQRLNGLRDRAVEGGSLDRLKTYRRAIEEYRASGYNVNVHELACGIIEGKLKKMGIPMNGKEVFFLRVIQEGKF